MARRRKTLPDEAELRDLQFFFRQRQRVPPDPRRINNLLANLMAQRGYGQLSAAAELEEAWREVAGAAVAERTRLGKVTRGVLQVYVRGAALMQELTFKKQTLVAELARRLPDHRLRDVKFRVDTP